LPLQRERNDFVANLNGVEEKEEDIKLTEKTHHRVESEGGKQGWNGFDSSFNFVLSLALLSQTYVRP